MFVSVRTIKYNIRLHSGHPVHSYLCCNYMLTCLLRDGTHLNFHNMTSPYKCILILLLVILLNMLFMV